MEYILGDYDHVQYIQIYYIFKLYTQQVSFCS